MPAVASRETNDDWPCQIFEPSCCKDMVRDERAGKLQRGDVEVNCGSSRENSCLFETWCVVSKGCTVFIHIMAGSGTWVISFLVRPPKTKEDSWEFSSLRPTLGSPPLYSFCTRVPHSGHGGDHLMIFEGRNSQLYRKRWVVPSPFRKDQSWPKSQYLATHWSRPLHWCAIGSPNRFATILPLNRFLIPLQIFPSACQTVPYSNSRVGLKGFPVSSHLAGQISKSYVVPTVLKQHLYWTPSLHFEQTPVELLCLCFGLIYCSDDTKKQLRRLTFHFRFGCPLK